ncbi:MAG: GntR family transcriptional regulator [Lachnospiraceae bacterium]|nr:GntR family transcriptional regulator [Lachnospiraceae bacterium]MDY5540183.1 GntR family transcriptional regulator [Lachnospiraceae bacterium]
MRHKLLNLDERVAQDLRIKIEEGDYQPGQILPGERELAQIYGIQRNTIRKALRRMINAGMLKVNSRCGYTVAEPRYQICVSKLMDMEDCIKNKVIVWKNVLVSQLVLQEEEAEKLQLNKGQELIEIKRCAEADGQPLCLERWLLPKDRLYSCDLSGTEQIYACGRSMGKGPVYANQMLDIFYAGSEESKILEVELLEPLVLLQGYSYDASGILFDYHEQLFRSDRFLFVASEADKN